MGKPITHDEAIVAITNRRWVYKPKVFAAEDGFPEAEIELIIQPPYDTWDDLVIAASYALTWLETMGLTKEQLQTAWWTMVDTNSIFSIRYKNLSWETVMLMMDKASYVAKEMVAMQLGGSR